MINQIKRPVAMIVAGLMLIAAAFLIMPIKTTRWDNFLLGCSFGIGVVVFSFFITTAIKRSKAQ